MKNIYYTSSSSIQYNFISDDSIFEEVTIRNVSSNINCADIDCIKLIIISHIHNNHIVIYIYLVDNLLNFCPYVFICNPLRWIFTKIVHYSLKIFFGGIKSNIFGKVFDDGSNDNAFGWPDYLRNTVEYILILFFIPKLIWNLYLCIFLILADISAIRSDLRSFFVITGWCLLWWIPKLFFTVRALQQLFFRDWSSRSI